MNDSYFQFEPGIAARAPVGLGAFTAEYAPSFRAGANFAATQDPSHVLTGTLDLPFGSDSQFTLSDRYVASTLDTREVDPGGEYFFDLARFQRNLLSANARLSVAPRLFVELGGAYNHVSFEEHGRLLPLREPARHGRGGLRGLAHPARDPLLRLRRGPRAGGAPRGRSHRQLRPPDACRATSSPSSRAACPLGYRDQESPNAAAGGQRYRGFTMSGSLTREFGRESSLSLIAQPLHSRVELRVERVLREHGVHGRGGGAPARRP